MIKRRIKYPAQGRNVDYKFGSGAAASVLGVASTGGGGGGTATASWLEQYFNFDFANDRLKALKTLEVDDLIINGSVDRWLSETLIVADARIRVNRTQGAATVASGMDIWNGTSIVSSLDYGVDSIWRAGGQRIYTDAYKPLADNATNLGGYSAASYPRKAEAATITGAWGIVRNGEALYLQPASINQPSFIRGKSEIGENLWYIGRPSGSSLDIGCMNYSNAGLWFGTNSAQRVRIDEVGFMGVGTIAPSERLHVAGNGLFEGNNITINRTGLNGAIISLNRNGVVGWTVHGGYNASEDNLALRRSDGTPVLTLAQNLAAVFSGSLAVSGTSTLTGAVTAGGNVGGAGTFVGGFAGSNWRIEAGAENHLTVDRLTVRGRMDIYELVINKIRASNGSLWVSDALECGTVQPYGVTPPTFNVYPKEGDDRPVPFLPNDIVRGQEFDGKNVRAFTGVVYWVDASGSFFRMNILSGSPWTGMTLVRIGNTNSSSGRQGSLYLTSSDSNAPYLDVLDGVNSASFAGKTKVRLGKLNGITDADLGTLTGYGLYAENAYLKGKIVAGEGKIGGWNLATQLFYSGSWDANFGAGSGIKLDAVNRSIMAQYDIPHNSVEMFYRSSNEWGLVGKKANTTVFQLGSTNQIAGINFDDSRMYTSNWELNKDGSFYFGAGGEIEGSLITGLIQSQNWNGVNGTRINLIDGSMDYGNVIHINANDGEINLRDLNADRLGVRIGDFDLSSTTSGSSFDRTLSQQGSGLLLSYSWSYTRWLDSTSSPSSVESVYATLPQNTYNLFYPLLAQLVDDTREQFTGITLQEGWTGGVNAKITVYLDGVIINIAESQIVPYAGLASLPVRILSLPVNFNFTGSGDLKVKIEMTGYSGYRDSGGIQWYPRIPARLNATTIKVTPFSSVTELSTKGLQSIWGPTKYFRIYDKVGIDNFVETRGVQQYISPNGTYRLRVSDAGIQKSINGGSTWTAL